ncbi:HEPN domain-containing protein [Phenylobacterium sp. J426]|uniref:HEPN domain-containing protein n=1 Tax=Phenylobacterium sp. J426 TaxID=2898439 RepID=UPI002150E5B4|nr:HEPN domain-containing protein [Phenylobacterium sp. J426]MCR5873658.1 HEPN domain-containing protein [Phenylobacterium sp. J426]
MKTSLEHLPDGKRAELTQVLEVLFREFEDVTRRKGSARLHGRILKVILFGSYARGNWVDDPVGGYKSDYDLLIVVNHDDFADVTDYWMDAEAHLEQAFDIAHTLTAPAQFIVHSLADVNRQLTRGRPFFTHIFNDGIALYEAPDHPFSRPEKLSRDDAFREAAANFEKWFPSASGFFDTAQYVFAQGRNNEAAFQLHQTTERYYHCVLLTQTLYSTKSHNLNFLRGQAERVAPELIPAWPRGNRFEKRCWELLRRAYVEARFSDQYEISTEQLAWLVDRLKDLQARVEQSCRDYLATIAPPA